MKVYRGVAAAARHYVESDRSRADDYYLAEGSGLAERYTASLGPAGATVTHLGSMDGDEYEVWVSGHDPETGLPKGRLRADDRAVRFVEVTINGPKTWSLAAAVHPEIAQAYDAAQVRAAAEITAYLTSHLTTRVGPRGRQVQVPVERLEVATVAHRTSRAGDPHRHLHFQLNSRVWAHGKWCGVHTVGFRDTLAAINGIGGAAVQCDPDFRRVLNELGYTLDPVTGEIVQLAPYVGTFSARASQIGRNVDRYEAEWRAENPGEEPGRRLLQAWDTRAWKDDRPDKVVPLDGVTMNRRWIEVLDEEGFRPPAAPALRATAPSPGALDREKIVDGVVVKLGSQRSAWNVADIRGAVEDRIAAAGVVTTAAVRTELAEDLTSRAVDRCVQLVDHDGVPEHIRSLTSPQVLAVERALTTRLTTRAEQPSRPDTASPHFPEDLDPGQRAVVAAIAGTAQLVVVEGAAGSGKTTTLAAARDALLTQNRRLLVVTPTLKAAQIAGQQLQTPCATAKALVYAYGFREDNDGRWTRVPGDPAQVRSYRIHRGDVLLVDEAGMLDQDTALALQTIADECRAHTVFVGDRHQLAAVGRGGVLDLGVRCVRTEDHHTLDIVHRFSDPEYAELSLLMRTGERSGEVFDALLARGQIQVHATDVERTRALAATGASRDRPLVMAVTNQQVDDLNATIRDELVVLGQVDDTRGLTTHRGQRVGVGDRVATRANDRDLRVANRDTWTVTDIGDNGAVHLSGASGRRLVSAAYALEHLDLAHATTAYGAQGETVDRAHAVVDSHSSGSSAYVGMTRGRRGNTAHLVADNIDDARQQWIDVFDSDRADLGPGHAGDRARADLDLYGTRGADRSPLAGLQAAALRGTFHQGDDLGHGHGHGPPTHAGRPAGPSR